MRSLHDEIENLSCERDDDATGEGQKAVGTLRSVMTLECEAHLNNAKCEQDDADRANQPEDKLGQIIDYGDRIGLVGKGRRRHAEHEDDDAEDGEQLLGTRGKVHAVWFLL